MRADDLVVGRGVTIIRGRFAGKTGMIVDFDENQDQVDVQISGTDNVRYLGLDDVKLIDPYQTAFRKFENQNNKNKMEKLVFESLDELFESKKEEKSKAQKVKQTKCEKAEQAIEALKKQLALAKKPGAFKTTTDKRAKVKELEDKIKVWEKKMKEAKE